MSDDKELFDNLSHAYNEAQEKISSLETSLSEKDAALRELGNLIGGPTMTYSAVNEIEEWRGRAAKASVIVQKALSLPAGEKPLQCEAHGYYKEHCPECQLDALRQGKDGK